LRRRLVRRFGHRSEKHTSAVISLPRIIRNKIQFDRL
jgi:hypothetical protein